MKKECIFCKIINKKNKQKEDIIYEDKKTIALLDISPASKKGGHTLVIPKKHYELVTEMPDEDLKAIMFTIRKISKALMSFALGMNIIQNNKKVAGQYIKHVHFHLVPRFPKDGITIEKWTTFRYKDELHRQEIASKIKNLLKE
ncbi:HIT family protein [Candidatus Woesearchaeota archaeon]|nr:HIT family protein [Candidatus Woesearchaeota archaeon]